MHKIINVNLYIIVFLLLSNQLKANTYSTVVNGNWSNQGCWANQSIPSFSFTDTVIIKHHMVLPNDITLLNSAYLLIESTGGLCGHVQMQVNVGTSVLKYGILEIDALNMSGGTVDLLPPGNTIFTQYGLLTGGTFNNTSNLMVGPWFECQMPEYQFLNALNNELKKVELNIFPNPVEHFITLDLPASTQPYQLCVYDIKGAIVLQKQLSFKQALLDVNEFKPGLYYMQLIGHDSTALTRFCKE